MKSISSAIIVLAGAVGLNATASLALSTNHDAAETGVVGMCVCTAIMILGAVRWWISLKSDR